MSKALPALERVGSPPWLRRALLLVALGAAAPAATAQTPSALRIACDGPSAGAEVTVNGQFKGECPLDMEIAAGRVEILAIKKVDPLRERRFSQSFAIGEGVVKRVEVVVGPVELNAAGRRAEQDRQRLEAERQRIADEAARKAEAERKAREAAEAERKAAEAARQAEFRRLAGLQAEQRQRERIERTLASFQAAGLVAGTGQGFRDCPECPELVWIPPGRAPQIVGVTDSQRWYNETSLALPLAVGRFEVTFDEWDACVAQGGCQRRPAEGVTEGMIFDSKWGRGRQPVINISHRDAQQYVAWLSKRTGQRYRLLSQVEFNYAARAGAGTLYPWGDRLEAGAANCPGCGGKANDERPLAVGSFAANAWGLHDMMGNAAEFLADCYGSRSRASQNEAQWVRWVNLPEQPRDGRPIDQCSAAPGRAAVSDPVYAVAAGRFNMVPSSPHLLTQWVTLDFVANHNGLRVAREFAPPAPTVDVMALAPYRDCADCPEMVNLPAGRFEMGTPYLFDQGWDESETPLRWVSVPAFAIGRTEITRGQWATFQRERPAVVASPPAAVATTPAPALSAAGVTAGSAAPATEPGAPGTTPAAPGPAVAATPPSVATPVGCSVPVVNGERVFLRSQPGRGWADPGFPQDDSHPAVCITRADAEAFVAWLSQRTGQRYRLPTEAEWEYAARAGSEDRRPWGRDQASACLMANVRDQQYREAFGDRSAATCRDDASTTAPVGRRRPNAWGLLDMVGNAAEHVADCWGLYGGAPTDGSAVTREACNVTLVRGGSWYSHPNSTAASVAGRQTVVRNEAVSTTGLRVVREIGPAGAPK